MVTIKRLLFYSHSGRDYNTRAAEDEASEFYMVVDEVSTEMPLDPRLVAGKPQMCARQS